MASILLLHSVCGLRDFERSAADRLRAAGHDVATPDLFDGEHPATWRTASPSKDASGPSR